MKNGVDERNLALVILVRTRKDKILFNEIMQMADIAELRFADINIAELRFVGIE